MNNQRPNGSHPIRMRLAAAALCCVALSGCETIKEMRKEMREEQNLAATWRAADRLRAAEPQPRYELAPEYINACILQGQLVASATTPPATTFYSRRHPGKAFGLSVLSSVATDMSASATQQEATNACLATMIAEHGRRID